MDYLLMQMQTDVRIKNRHQKAVLTLPLLGLNLPQSLPSLIFHHFHFYPPHSQVFYFYLFPIFLLHLFFPFQYCLGNFFLPQQRVEKFKLFQRILEFKVSISPQRRCQQQFMVIKLTNDLFFMSHLLIIHVAALLCVWFLTTYFIADKEENYALVRRIVVKKKKKKH